MYEIPSVTKFLFRNNHTINRYNEIFIRNNEELSRYNEITFA